MADQAEGEAGAGQHLRGLLQGVALIGADMVAVDIKQHFMNRLARCPVNDLKAGILEGGFYLARIVGHAVGAGDAEAGVGVGDKGGIAVAGNANHAARVAKGAEGDGIG